MNRIAKWVVSFVVIGLTTDCIASYLYLQWKKRRMLQNEFDVMFMNSSSLCCIGTKQPRADCHNKHCRLKISGRIVEAIDAAKSSIRVAMYMFSYKPLLQALIRANRRGVTVRILVDERIIMAKAIEQLELAGIAIRHFKRLSQTTKVTTDFLMHHKFCIIDADIDQSNNDFDEKTRLFIGGSLNWSNNSFSTNCENILFSMNSKIIDPFKAEFDVLWETSQKSPLVVGY